MFCDGISTVLFVCNLLLVCQNISEEQMESVLAETLVNTVQAPLQVLAALNLASVCFPPQAVVSDGDIFDYVLIGSGVGSVVANRLTEDSDISVLLVEAGSDPSVESIFPGLFPFTQDSYIDWGFISEYENNSLSQDNNTYKMPSGKVLGGSSCMNHLILLRSDPSDYDTWATVTNDSSWKYENVLEYFIKSETMKDSEILNSTYKVFHGTEGPVGVTREPKEASVKYLEAFEETGHETVLDLNGNYTLGYAETTFNIANYVRQSNSVSYLSPIKDRSNLHVLKQAQAIKIIFDNYTAVAVQLMLDDDTIITVNATQEVIVSGGVFNSPKLLLNSGIGPKEDLENLNITVLKDLPVGKNMQDHLGAMLVTKMEKSLEISELPALTYVSFPVIIGAATTDETKLYPEYQTTNIVFTHDTPYLLLVCAVIFNFRDEFCQSLVNDSIGRNTLFTLVGVLHPKSRGQVKLRSADPKDDPMIYTGFYSDESDLDDMVKYIQDYIKVHNSTYFKGVDAELIALELPGCEGSFNDTEYIRCYARYMSASILHYTSTCSMGSVVDNELKVYGFDNLRVVDASVMPNITRANPHAAAIMIAEKASDLIKAARTNKSNSSSTEVSETTTEESTSVVEEVLEDTLGWLG